MPWIARIASFALLAGSCLFPTAALADAETGVDVSKPSAMDESLPDDYRHAIKLAIDEVNHRNYAEARARFMEAHRLLPSARTLRGLGIVEYELRNYRASVDYLERSLASDVRPLPNDLRAGVERVLGLARGYLAKYTVKLTPADATLEIDGEPAQVEQDGSLVLEVGDHDLIAHAKGFATKRRHVSVASGEEGLIDLRLMPAPDRPDRRDTSRPLRKRWWVWTLAGVLAAGAATGIALSLRGSTVADPGEGSPDDTLITGTDF